MEKKRMQVLLISALFLCSHVVNVSATRPAPMPGSVAPRGEKHYVLVHGPVHGAWCWYKVVTLLRSSGNNVTAIDLAGSGINLENYTNIHSISDYLQPLASYMASLSPEEKVVLVGHAFGGIVMSYMMERFSKKISVAVFLAGLMPGPTYNASTVYEEARSAEEQEQQELDNRNMYDEKTNASVISFGPAYLKTYLYQLSPIEDYRLALLLLRPQHVYTSEDIANVVVLTPERFGIIPRVYIVNEFDKAVPTSFQLSNIKRNPPDEALQINGTDHMVMFTKPVELVDILRSIAARYS